MILELPDFERLRHRIAATVWASPVFAQPFTYHSQFHVSRTVWGHLLPDENPNPEGYLEQVAEFRCLAKEHDDYPDRGFIDPRELLVNDSIVEKNGNRPYFFTGEIRLKTPFWLALVFVRNKIVHKTLRTAT